MIFKVKKLFEVISGRKEYLLLLFLNIFISFGTIIIYKLIKIKFDDEMLFDFTYIKRIIAFLSPISLLGTGVTLIRFIGTDINKNSEYYILTSIFLTLFTPLGLIILNIFNEGLIINFLWNKHEILHSKYFYPLIIYLIGLNTTTVAICKFRGLKKYFKSTYINLCLIVLMPLIVLIYATNINHYLFYNGLLLIFFSLIILVNKKMKINLPKTLLIKTYIKEGITRLFGDISYYFLIFAPSYFILKFTGDLSMTAALSFCQILVNASTILIKPVSLVKLPWTVKQKEFNNLSLIKNTLIKETTITFLVFLIITLFLVSSIETIINLVYTNNILEYILSIKIYLFLIPFYCCFLILRNYVDGITNKPINFYINTVGIILFIAQIYTLDFGNEMKTIAISMINSFLVMDIIIVVYIIRFK